MRAQEFLPEVITDLGNKYQELYTQYYKRAHLAARKKGMDSQSAANYARQALDAYKDRIRTGEWDPITRTKGAGRATYAVKE